MKDLVEKGYFYEYKSTTEFWIKRLRCLRTPCRGVFLVGNEVNIVTVLNCTVAKTQYIPQEYEEAITTDKCFVLKCCFEMLY